MKRKVILLFAMGIATISLCACGSEKSGSVNESGTETEQEETVVNDVKSSETETETETEKPDVSEPTSAADEINTDEKPGTTENKTEEASEDWKIEFEKSLLDNYGVTVDHYEYLGDGIYQVYVEIDGKIVPYVAVDSNTGNYHG